MSFFVLFFQVHYPSDPLQPGPVFFLNYLIDEAHCISKGSNVDLAYLHHFFSQHGHGEKHVQLHCDNCKAMSNTTLTCSRFLSTNDGASPCSWFNTVPRLCGPWLSMYGASFVSAIACSLLDSCLLQASPRHFQFLQLSLSK